ncbi:SGNH/GDSL hydrolase family protein [Halobacillus salinarum]|uniref:SGNH/GDSL hydrolase family protein n=1 Tax=Halobacillus salinarum TaxID=2932257 RepID=A0ABY4ENK6_9BACI|nr:SGNH/GDSL hydrolase family protein [Halobacillus salinarum]UOQ45197.1 SGNH/GDSL hydrolase family protein [Halobacillus salinarum]
MRKFLWMIAVFMCLLIFGIISLFYMGNGNFEEDSGQSTAPQHQEKNAQQQKDKDQEKEKKSPDEKQAAESAENNDSNLGDGIREVFNSVIAGAKTLFVQDDIKIVAIGDSLTQGVGDGTNNGGYVGILEKSINSNEEAEDITIANYGKRGNRTDQLLERMKQDEISSSLNDADIVLITIGANDVMKVVKSNFRNLNYQEFVNAQAGYKQRLKQIFDQIHTKNPDASIYLLGLYNPFNSYFKSIPELSRIMSDYNRISKEVVKNQDNVTFIPIKGIFTGSEEELLWQEDHFHPNEKGYKKIAERVLDYIKPEIKQ